MVWVSVGAVSGSGSLVLSCCLSCCLCLGLSVSGGLVLSLVVFSGLVVSGSGSVSCVGLWVSGGLCVGLWCCVSGGLVWWSVCRAVSRAGNKKNHQTRKRRATK